MLYCKNTRAVFRHIRQANARAYLMKFGRTRSITGKARLRACAGRRKENKRMRAWLEKIRWQFGRWMQGRYGQDSLTGAMLILALILILASSIFSIAWLNLLSLLLLVLTMLRTYSKNTAKRRAENEKWLSLTKPVRQAFTNAKRRFAERKTHRYFKCPKCGQQLRVPRGKGRIAITCKNCGNRFERKT